MVVSGCTFDTCYPPGRAGPRFQAHIEQCKTDQNGQLELAAIGGQAPYQFELRTNTGEKIGKWKLDNENDTQLVELAVSDYQLILTDQNGVRYEENFFFQAKDAPIALVAVGAGL